MACGSCGELRPRVEALERMASELLKSPRRAPIVGRAGAWPAEWPQPGPEERAPSRVSAFKAGGRARRDGTPATSCPYGSQSRGHDNSWRRGWKAMDRHMKAERPPGK